MASPSAGAPALKYRYVNTQTSSHGEVKGLIDYKKENFIKLKKNKEYNYKNNLKII